MVTWTTGSQYLNPEKSEKVRSVFNVKVQANPCFFFTLIDARTTRSQSKSVSENIGKDEEELLDDVVNSDEPNPCELYDDNYDNDVSKTGNDETVTENSSVLEKGEEEDEPVPSTSRESANATPVNVIYDFKCNLCPETFKTSKVLATHVKLHRGEYFSFQKILSSINKCSFFFQPKPVPNAWTAKNISKSSMTLQST
jgi:hypothetical protein